jgi:adenylate cyclase
MPTEIERKFLVANDQWREQADGGTCMRQGYLCADRQRAVRIRLSDTSARLTIKGAGQGISRSEYEYDIPESDAREMLQSLCVHEPIAKTRYRVRHGAHVWEVDVFEGANAGLVLAEVELDEAHESVELPDWVGPEVSGDEHYYNAYLARHPFTCWPD